MACTEQELERLLLLPCWTRSTPPSRRQAACAKLELDGCCYYPADEVFRAARWHLRSWSWTAAAATLSDELTSGLARRRWRISAVLEGSFSALCAADPGPVPGPWRNDGLLLLQKTLSFQSFSSPWMVEHRLPRLRTDTAPAPSAPSSSPRVSRGQSFFTMGTPGGSCQGSTYQLPHAKYHIWMDNGAVRTSSVADLVTLLSGGA